MDRDSPSSLPPTLLEPPPPATIISPPSPTKDKTITKDPSQPDMISSQASPTIESPDSLPQSSTGSPPPMSTPLPAPASPAFLRPTSPPFASSSVSITVRSPSPSSPSFRPKGPLHRRTSSAHRVRETIDGTQTANEDGERMINQYKIGMSLGQGAYAKVELGVDINTGVKYAIKEFSKSRLHHQSLQEKHRATMRSKLREGRARKAMSGDERESRERPSQPMEKEEMSGTLGGTQPGDEKMEDPLGLIRREIAVMKKLDHPNLVHLYEAISVSTADALFLVLEYMPGGTLMKVKIGEDDSNAQPPFDREQTREYFRQLCLGLEYLHANEVVHRDIKPENILLSTDRQLVKLCDFGVSEMFTKTGDDRIQKSGGSPAFQSPESFQPNGELHGKAVDIWALGVTLYCMLTGTLPFNYPNIIELYAALMEKSPRIPEDWDASLRDLIERMLCKDPALRIDMSSLREHPWTTDETRLPMIDREENLFEVGKQVEEPTQDEIKDAIVTFRGILYVMRAVHKMRRLHLRRSSPSRGATSSPGGSANASFASESMDSYVSHDRLTSTTSLSSDGEDGQYKDIAGNKVMSPRKMSLASPADTVRPDATPPMSFGNIEPIKTDVQENVDGVVLVDSPTSENEDAGTEKLGSGSSRDLQL
ncbi:calcium/calmodulin-dependent protein kinase kinase [Cryptococcus neoformans var. grubii Br795]|nr:calcium/calmodulin-dependent protein kinase kinase [Cryptococcus neoformans var. grubii Br795]